MAEAAVPGPDTHASQAGRVADHCDAHAGQFFTLFELTHACDLASASKVLSAMACELGYGVAKGWMRVTCADGLHFRRVRTYRVTHRPMGIQTELAFDA